jgi:hypothetical protein
MFPLGLVLCHFCSREVLDTVEACPHCGASPVKVRGVLSILFWAVAGLTLGAVVAPLVTVVRSQREKVDRLVESSTIANGAAIGAVIGLCVGTFLWVFFPYKTKAHVPTNEAPPADEPELG